MSEVLSEIVGDVTAVVTCPTVEGGDNTGEMAATTKVESFINALKRYGQIGGRVT